MVETYAEMSTRHKSELDALPIQWAFSQKQMIEGLSALGIEPGQSYCKNHTRSKKKACKMRVIIVL